MIKNNIPSTMTYFQLGDYIQFTAVSIYYTNNQIATSKFGQIMFFYRLVYTYAQRHSF